MEIFSKLNEIFVAKMNQKAISMCTAKTRKLIYAYNIDLKAYIQ